MNASRHFYAIAGIVTLLTASGLATSRSHTIAFSNTLPVLVTNGSSSPVPTAAQGTTQVGGTVAVSSLPAVQLGSGNSIAISGEPTVHVDPNDTVNVSGSVTSSIAPNQTINVGNGPGSPIPVQEVEPPRTPVSASMFGAIDDGVAGTSTVLYTVPSGKQLEVRDVTVRIQLPDGQLGFIDFGYANVEQVLPITSKGSGFFDGALTSCSFVVPGGQNFLMQEGRSDVSGPAHFLVSFDGSLVDAP